MSLASLKQWLHGYPRNNHELLSSLSTQQPLPSITPTQHAHFLCLHSPLQRCCLSIHASIWLIAFVAVGSSGRDYLAKSPSPSAAMKGLNVLLLWMCATLLILDTSSAISLQKTSQKMSRKFAIEGAPTIRTVGLCGSNCKVIKCMPSAFLSADYC